MKKYIYLILLTLLPFSEGWAQGRKSKVKELHLNFANHGLGIGCYLKPDVIPNVNLQLLDLNFSPKFANGYGLRVLSAGSMFPFYGGEWHDMFGPSYSFKTSKRSVATVSLLGGLGYNSFLSDHDQEICISKPYDPHKPQGLLPNEHSGDPHQYPCLYRYKGVNGAFAYGLSYRQRFFADRLFNLTLGLDIVGMRRYVDVLPSIGCSISW